MSRLFGGVVLALLVCAPAEAATTVARDGGLELRARERGGRLCMTLRRDHRYQGRACGRIPRSPHRPLRMFPDVGFATYVAGGRPVGADRGDRERARAARTRQARGGAGSRARKSVENRSYPYPAGV